MTNPLAIACSDIHLSNKCPIARSAEPDWRKAQLRALNELRRLQKTYDCPIICAGDVFDKANQPIDFVNWCLEHVPQMYAIPGQHDMVNHNYEQLNRSAYWTLVKCGIIDDLSEVGAVFADEDFQIHGYPFGFVPDEPDEEIDTPDKTIVVIHKYIWKKGYGHPLASKEDSVRNWKDLFSQYGAFVFGDNHRGFQWRNVLNCGALIRRSIDEREYQPYVGLIYWDDSKGKFYIHRVPISTEHDKFLSTESIDGAGERELQDLKRFIDVLDHIEHDSLDFREVVENALREMAPRKRVADIVFAAIDLMAEKQK